MSWSVKASFLVLLSGKCTSDCGPRQNVFSVGFQIYLRAFHAFLSLKGRFSILYSVQSTIVHRCGDQGLTLQTSSYNLPRHILLESLRQGRYSSVHTLKLKILQLHQRTSQIGIPSIAAFCNDTILFK